MVGLDERSLLVVAADASGPVKEGVRAVGIDMHLDPRLNEVRPHRALRDLQLQRPVGHAVVVSDLPLLLYAQDLVEFDAWDRGEGRALAGRLDRETGVVRRQVGLAEEGVGVLDGCDPGEPELLDEAVLKRLERPLGATAGLRREGADMLDSKLLERRPTWVSWPRSISPALGVKK